MTDIIESKKQPINHREMELIEELSAYDLNILQYRQALQFESQFLFLATLGCWSISADKCIQAFAFIITALFFAVQVYRRLDSKKSFSRFEKDISNLIKNEFLAGLKKESYICQLNQLNKKRSSHRHIFKNTPLFFVCTAFYVWSFYDQVVCGIFG